uniref:G-protein coupled receptors family 1 profile domain-containing protein n=1 Tax=Meloidogyne floridensis TaxID=298350 RepID=A0A915NRQ7_9BILA
MKINNKNNNNISLFSDYYDIYYDENNNNIENESLQNLINSEFINIENIEVIGKFEQIMLLCYFIPLFFIGLFGNIWLIGSILKLIFKHYIPAIMLRQMSIYILMLAFVDLMVILTIPLHLPYMITGQWNLGIFCCKLLVAVENINKLFSVMILTCMSIERFVVVCRPFEYWGISGLTNRKRRIFDSFILLAILLITVGIFCSPFIYYANVSREIFIFSDGNVHKGNTFCSSHLPERLMASFISTHSKPAVRSILRVVIFHFLCWTPFWIFVSLPLLSHFKLVNIEPLFEFLPFIKQIKIIANMMNSQLRDSNNSIGGGRHAYMSIAMLPRTASFSNKRRSTRSTRSLLATSRL